MKRREFLKLSAAAGAGAALSSKLSFAKWILAAPAAAGLSDPAMQPKFVNTVPNALDPGFIFQSPNNKYKIAIEQLTQMTGLVGPDGTPVPTTVWGYGKNGPGGTWPGMTFEAKSGEPVEVKWENKLPKGGHLLPVDTSTHWAYSLPGYTQYSIEKDGPPVVPHLHGGHNDFQFDGNPEFFFSPGYTIRGPQWVDGIEKKFLYKNDQPAGTLWYHDHALGITRLNVYAGLAGFYILRDDEDTGLPGNDLGLPAFPYEAALAIQDRMFRNTGELFYPAFPGDPFYEDFITGEGAVLPPEIFPDGGPTALAEFFGDHMLVNGQIWPKMDVEPRNYRLRLLNGCDSRFMVIQFVAVDPDVKDPNDESASGPLKFWVIGSDQGLGTPAQIDTLVFETGGRYDIVFDFSDPPLDGKRVIMKNIGGDEPFSGDFPGPQVFGETDRIMAFDVVVPKSDVPDTFDPGNLPSYKGVDNNGVTTRRVALFEGTDEFGRLQPLLGTVKDGDLSGTNVAKAYTWFQPTTETPALNSTEIWEIYNFTADAHPIHLHLVNFEILDRTEFSYNVTGTQIVQQHNGTTGEAPEISNIQIVGFPNLGSEYFESAPKDMVTALPGDPDGNPPTAQVVRIRAHFDKPGRYVWHCHILSHEDHEMMRVLHVGGTSAEAQTQAQPADQQPLDGVGTVGR